MTTFTVTIVDEHGTASGRENSRSPETARASAIRSALQIFAGDSLDPPQRRSLSCTVQDDHGAIVSKAVVTIEVDEML